MDEIINKLINIDNTAKKIIDEAETKKENIDELVEESLTKAKNMIDSKYYSKIKFKESQLDSRLEKTKSEIESNLEIQLNQLENEYNLQEQKQIENILNQLLIEEDLG